MLIRFKPALAVSPFCFKRNIVSGAAGTVVFPYLLSVKRFSVFLNLQALFKMK